MAFISSPEGDLKSIFLTDAFLVDQFVGSSQWNWGYNYGGQIGNNSTVAVSNPTQTAAGGVNWSQVTAGRLTTIGVKTDGTLWTWGYNRDGTLGINAGSPVSSTWRSSPVQTVTAGTTWKTPSIGNYHAGCIKNDGTLWVWGYNFDGELGDNTATHRSSPIQTIAGGTSWNKLSFGAYHTGSIKTDGTLWVWGLNANGQIGDSSVANKSSPVQVLCWEENWTYVYAGYTSAGIKNDGTLWMWGNNAYGQIGNNSTTGFGSGLSSPVQTITRGTNWLQVECEGSYSWGVTTAAVKNDGTLWMWGNNSYGQLGDNTTVSKSSPVQTITFGTNWKQVSIGCGSNTGIGATVGAVKNDGTLWMWGNNTSGQLGDNTKTNRSSPVQTITFGTNWAAVSCGNQFTAGIKNDGTLWMWGNNGSGQLGINNTTSVSSPVQTVVGGQTWSKVSCSRNTSQLTLGTTAAVKTDGTLWVWGSNANGQLGDNTAINKSSPVQTITSTTNWSQVACGYRSIMALKTDGTLWCWGFNNGGILGDNTTTNKSSPVQTATFGNNWSKTSRASGLFLGGSIYKLTGGAVKKDGTLWIWGNNSYGQLGDNTTVSKSSPVQPFTYNFATNWNKISLGDYHSAGVKTNGTLWTWGRNGVGQLGDNTITHRSIPIQTFAYGMTWKDVACGYLHTAALKYDGTLWCFGSNTHGQLGDNTITHRSSPVQTIALGTSWKQVDCGYKHTAATKYDGTLWTWGDNEAGALGDNTITHRSSPIQTTAYGFNWKIVSCGQYHTTAVKNG
jgi:alpha-tubulin suppressor-like RCC1 family protein